ncbi:MAG: hypothetical protein ACXAC7_03915 [Candidatus Hodarchaeales archaeon]|jgi:hypothetical protein
MSNTEIQCPCGQIINDYTQYHTLFLKKDQNEVDILCPNEYCYLRELGFLKFEIDDSGEITFEKGRFYSPFVTWNATRLNEETTIKMLKQHLIDITEKHVHWKKIRGYLLEKGTETT